jgi:hypothetical protein
MWQEKRRAFKLSRVPETAQTILPTAAYSHLNPEGREAMNIVRNNSRFWFILAVDRFRARVAVMHNRLWREGEPMFPYINLN